MQSATGAIITGIDARESSAVPISSNHDPSAPPNQPVGAASSSSSAAAVAASAEKIRSKTQQRANVQFPPLPGKPTTTDSATVVGDEAKSDLSAQQPQPQVASAPVPDGSGAPGAAENAEGQAGFKYSGAKSGGGRGPPFSFYRAQQPAGKKSEWRGQVTIEDVKDDIEDDNETAQVSTIPSAAEPKTKRKFGGGLVPIGKFAKPSGAASSRRFQKSAAATHDDTNVSDEHAGDGYRRDVAADDGTVGDETVDANSMGARTRAPSWTYDMANVTTTYDHSAIQAYAQAEMDGLQEMITSLKAEYIQSLTATADKFFDSMTEKLHNEYGRKWQEALVNMKHDAAEGEHLKSQILKGRKLMYDSRPACSLRLLEIDTGPRGPCA